MNTAREHPNCKAVIWGKQYTSKTCSICLTLHPNIGDKQELKFTQHNLKSDRDFNAASNILSTNMSPTLSFYSESFTSNLGVLQNIY